MKKLVKKILPSRTVKSIGRLNADRKRLYTPKYKHPLNDGELDIVISYNSDGGYAVPSKSIHRPAAQKIMSGSFYETNTLNFINDVYEQGDVVHAGTYFGDMLPQLSGLVGDNGVVWGFEPNIESFRCAQITVLLNGLENVRLQNVGLGDRKGDGVFVTHDLNNGQSLGGSSYFDNEREKKKGGNVSIVTIDDVLSSSNHIAIIHLDVEGYEKLALAGSVGIIKRDLPILILETVPDDVWLAENLFSLGYRETEIIDNNTVFQVV